MSEYVKTKVCQITPPEGKLIPCSIQLSKIVNSVIGDWEAADLVLREVNLLLNDQLRNGYFSFNTRRVKAMYGTAYFERFMRVIEQTSKVLEDYRIGERATRRQFTLTTIRRVLQPGVSGEKSKDEGAPLLLHSGTREWLPLG